jgi:RNA polymerase sigma-70 factor (ECF subfamily)
MMDADPPASEETRGLLATRDLLPAACAGDVQAREQLFARFTPVLRRFLHARLPPSVRGLLDTDDLVQEVWASALAQLHRLEYRGPGAFWCYLRRIGQNHVAHVVRRSTVQTLDLEAAADVSADEDAPAQPTHSPEPVRALLEKERLGAFERALECISMPQRQALLMRLELELPYDVIAAECGQPSADAARMVVCRAMAKVAERLARDGFRED